MSYEEQGTAHDPKARGHERQGRKKAPRYVFSASAHIREDWSAEDLIDMLESRARGYNGTLRQVLCTAAQRLQEQQNVITEYKSAYAADEDELNVVVNEMRETGETDAQGGM